MAAAAADANEEPSKTSADGTNTPASTDVLLRSMLILQEQLHTTQREIQQAREEAVTSSRRASDVLSERLNAMEQKQMEVMQASNRFALTVVCIIAGLACLAVMLNGWMQMRAVTRLADISRQLELLPELVHPHSIRAITNGDSGHTTATASVEAGTRQLAGNMDRLNRRVDQLAETANGISPVQKVVESPTAVRTPALIAKGQTLMNLEKPEEALACFEEIIELDGHNIEAWVKRGAALERLLRTDEALAAYDRAIELDGNTATAYLFKAGILNRQKRYGEALQCYEKALSAQKSRGPASPAHV